MQGCWENAGNFREKKGTTHQNLGFNWHPDCFSQENHGNWRDENFEMKIYESSQKRGAKKKQRFKGNTQKRKLFSTIGLFSKILHFDINGIVLLFSLGVQTCSLQPGRLPGVDVPQSTYCSEGVANFDPSWRSSWCYFPTQHCSEEVAHYDPSWR